MKSRSESERPGPDPDPGPIPPDPSPFPPPPVPDPQPHPPNPPTRPPIPQLLGVLFAVMCCSLLGGWSIGSAQLASGPLPPAQQSPVVASPVPSAGAPASSGISAKIITPATTNRLAPSPERPENARGFRSAGRGLPGRPGGPPLTSPLGAREPRAPTIGPLFCDPLVDLSC